VTRWSPTPMRSSSNSFPDSLNWRSRVRTDLPNAPFAPGSYSPVTGIVPYPEPVTLSCSPIVTLDNSQMRGNE
jgi:hypothetical protein